MANEETIQKLQLARDYLAISGWVRGIGDSEGATCAIGALGRAYGYKEEPDKDIWWGTDEIIDWLAEVDGDAVRALGRQLETGREDERETRAAHRDATEAETERAVIDVLATCIFSFNDTQIELQPVLDLYDNAIASLR